MLRPTRKFEDGDIRLFNCLSGLIETCDYRIFKISKYGKKLINDLITDLANDHAVFYDPKKENN